MKGSMTVAALHKELTELLKEGHGRKKVTIDKSSFYSSLEADGACILDVQEVSRPSWVPTANDDGGVKINADGSESGKYVVILYGSEREV